jgi:hypothetical protein
MLLIRKEGFADKPLTPKQIQFFREASIAWILAISTDESSPTSNILRQVGTIWRSSQENVKLEDINIDKVINTINSKYNEDRFASTAYKIMKTFMIPTIFDEKYKGDQNKASNDIVAMVPDILKKIHKKMPSYPFSQFAIDKLKEESKIKIPKMEDCKAHFKCSGIEKIPKSLD